MNKPIMLDDLKLHKVMQAPDYRKYLLEIAERAVAAETDDARSLLSLAKGDDVAANVALLLSKSRRIALETITPARLAIVVPMWREVRRIKPFTAENPHGESCVSDKLETLAWLFGGTGIDWHLYFVDDDCPEGSAAVAEQAIEEGGFGENATVLRLSTGFPYALPPLSRMESLESSNKGGAVLLGCAAAVEAGFDYIGYTDCDNSVHIGQLGLLLPHLERHSVVMGNRWSGNPYSWFHSSRELHLDKLRIVFHLKGLLDLQTVFPDVISPFKVFRRRELAAILAELDRFDFCFDFDIAGAATQMGLSCCSEGVILFDSHAETSWNHFGHARIWYQKLNGMVSAARKFELPHEASAASLVDRYVRTPDDLMKVFASTPPKQILESEISALGKVETFSIEETAHFLAKSLAA